MIIKDRNSIPRNVPKGILTELPVSFVSPMNYWSVEAICFCKQGLLL